MLRPLFSIITVTYNAETTLPRTLASVAAQTCRMFEYLIVDGVSTDRTLKLAIGAGIPEARIYSEPDRGIYDAMNKAIDRANGDYLLFLNAGDAFHGPDTLERMARAITDNDFPGVVYGQTMLVDNDGRYLAPRHLTAPKVLTLDSFKEGMTVCHQAFVPLRRLAPRFDLKWRFSADYEWCIRCLQKSRDNVYAGDTPLIDYLAEGTTTRNRRRSLIERMRIMAYYYGWPGTLWRHIGFVRRFLAHRNMMRHITTEQ